MADTELTLRVRVTPEGLQILDQIAEKSQKAGTSFRALGDDATRLNQALELGKKAWELIEGPIERVYEFLKEATNAASEHERAQRQLDAALRSTGSYTPAYSAALGEVADRLEKTSLATDKEALDLERMLIEFGAAPNQIEPLSRAVLDLAAGLGVDLPAATKLVDAALNGHTERLARYGIVIDQTLPKQQQLAQLQQQINIRFGGQAAAQVDTYAGSVKLAGDSYEHLLVAIGEVITRTPEAQAVWLSFAQVLDDLTRDLKSNDSEFMKWVSGGIHFSVDTMELFIKIVYAATKALETLGSVVDGTAFQKFASGESLTPVADSLKAIVDEGEAFKQKFDEISAKLKAEGPQAAKEGVQPITDEAKRAALASEQIGTNLEKIPTKKDVHVNIYQHLFGGGGGGGGGASGDIDPAVVHARQMIADDISKMTKGWQFSDTPPAGPSNIFGPGTEAGPPSGRVYGNDSGRAYSGLTIGGVPYLGPGGEGFGPPRPPEIYGPPAPAGGAAPSGSWYDTLSDIGSGISSGVSNALQQSNDLISSWAESVGAMSPEMAMSLGVVGSPKLPFTQYLGPGGYADSVVNKFASNLPPLTFRTNLSDVIGGMAGGGWNSQTAGWSKGLGTINQSADWSQRFGDSLLPSGAFDLIQQGTSADPGALRKAVSDALEEKRYFDWADKLNSHIMDLTTVTGEKIPNAGDYSRAFGNLAAQLERLIRLQEIMAQQGSQQGAQQVQLAQRAAIASEATASFLSSGAGATRVTTSAETSMRQATGNRALLFTSGR
jgi:hypothetical protein